jgi:putative ATPase
MKMEPLASKLRPHNLEGFVGQKHLVEPGKPLQVAIEKKHLFSFVLWGPPGVGKTTLARIYAKALDAHFYELSAVSTGKDEIRKIIEKQEDMQQQEETQEEKLPTQKQTKKKKKKRKKKASN